MVRSLLADLVAKEELAEKAALEMRSTSDGSPPGGESGKSAEVGAIGAPTL